MEAEGSESDDLVYSGPDFPEELDEIPRLRSEGA